jgi:hypothetical protein
MTMAKVKVSEKMQRAVRMIQSRIGNPPNQGYQNLSSDESSPQSGGSYLRKPTSLSRSGRSVLGSELDSDDEIPDSPPADVPEGFLAVYVGRERERFVISASYLRHQLFKVLLEKSAVEYGFEHTGGLPIACEVTHFKHLLWTIEAKDSVRRNLDMNTSCSCFAPPSHARTAFQQH